MKKIIALALALMMLLCASAVAEELPAVYFDEAVMETVPGDFMLIPSCSLILYVPEEMESMKLTEEDIAAGGIAAWMNDENRAISVACAPVTDGEGNAITDLETLHALYTASGIESTLGTVNDLPCLSFTLPESTLGGIAFMTEEGEVLAFSCTPMDEVAAVVLSSIMLDE